MADVFLSYSQQVPEPTVALADELTRRGFNPWYDVNLLPHQFFETVITDNVKRAQAVVTIWSRPALTSTWVPMESAMALGQNKLICVRAPDVQPGELPDMFRRMQVPVWTGEPGDETINAIFQSLVTLGVTPAAGADQTNLEKLKRAAQQDWRLLPDDDREALEAFLEEYNGLAMYRRMAEKRLRALGAADVTTPTPAPRPPEPGAPDVSDAEPILRLAPAMHTAVIRRISLTGDGAVIASASDDKTVKLWALPEGRLGRTLRPPIGAGDEGKVYAVAIDPAGR